MSDSAKADLGPDTLSLIRDLVTDENVTPEAPRAPSPRAQMAATPVEHVAVTAGPARRATQGRAKDALHRVVARLRGFRPSRRQIIWAAIALVVVLRPAWVVLALVLGLFLVLGVFLAFGPDRLWAGTVALLKWYIARAPERGARLAAWIDGFAYRWDSLLDLFPDGWVDALYLPDLQSVLEADDRHDAVMATRLQRLQDQSPDQGAAA
ncbi:hypothetical protein [Pseudosulfitobacter sp. DSM 107133]|uniref:hypothetical protein n=1 Tax=Pseudosulfitobacter sp. DSM 107133 TaxID=2883100 RepID=UPI000DF3C8A9|nr:hypothetical protein [Pseudosulfitobacter sp. DSM 107133]UOA28346.1 hypothetical protein DSM107133_03092 [Pseudosulfitobacter sp. DSM 107133]